MDKLLKLLKIDNDDTKPPKKAKYYTKVKDMVPSIANYNFMADLLMLPDDEGYKYLLVVVDLADNAFDIEPMKNKDAETTLKAFEAMFKRNYIKKPYASIRTDDGKEFKGVFQKYLYKNSILHKVALKDRHSQMANVERLNGQLGLIFNSYMNMKEKQLGKRYNNWMDILDEVRKELNKMRLIKNLKSPFEDSGSKFTPKFDPKFKAGDIVYRALDAPKDALGNDQNTKQFRMGDIRWDLTPKKIIKVLYYPGKVSYRYVLEGIKYTSFTENQLKKAPQKEKETKYTVKGIIGKKVIKGKNFYLVWWNGYKKEDATLEPENQLIDDGLKNIIDEFNRKNKR